MSHDDRHQAGASARSVLASSLVQGGRAPLEAGGVGADALTPLEAPEVPSRGAHDCRCSGTGGPQICLPAAHGVAKQQVVRPMFTNKAPKTLARGQASRGGRCKTSSGVV